MSKDPHQPGESDELRHRAEKRLKRQTAEASGLGSSAQTQRLVHELQVHQIELEMQNEELRESRTQVEKALQRYIDLYDFAPVGYLTLSAEGAIREVNLPGARLLGLERGRLVGRRLGTFVSQDTQSVFDAWVKEVFASHVKQSCVVSLAKEGRSSLVVEIEATLSTDGKEVRAVMVDITAREALEKQLQQARKMEVIGQLAGGVAHEFNNILAAMLLNLEMLHLQHQLPEEAQPSLLDLEALAKRAANLTRRLLLFSQQQAMHPVQVEFNSELANLLDMLKGVLGDEITCLLHPCSQELWGEVDVAMLDQALMNICLNARDAMPHGGTLTLETSPDQFDVENVSIHAESRPGRFLCLRISDTGHGMEADVLKHMFEPFFTTKEIGKGTGLGLASAYGIVHRHKGWINVESAVGLGTTFSLYLPLSVKAKAIPTATQILSTKGRNETILLVEDEEALLHISSRVLTMFGYRVLSAINGPAAWELWEQHRDSIDLVVTDMRMPKGISGLELAEKLWKAKPSLKIIIMSGYSVEMTSNSMASNENYTYLAKPFDLKVLSETVRRCLG